MLTSVTDITTAFTDPLSTAAAMAETYINDETSEHICR